MAKINHERRPRLEGKVAIVTGAGSSGPGVGTGKAISIQFAREGCKVLLVDHNKSAAEETLSAINSEGGEASVFETDVTISNDCQNAVLAASNRYGKLDILVNNVGILGPGNVVTVEEETYDKVMDVNLKGMVLMSKYSLPVMVEGGGGSIINMSSQMGHVGGPIRSVYNMTKSGLEGLTKGMAIDLARDNIRVNTVCPTFVVTPMTKKFLKNKKFKNNMLRNIPLGRFADLSDVATAVVFLASDSSSMITGTSILVDGGWTAI